jgi:uncharacterized membrane protein SpoIIM required for sporulation
MRIAALIIAGAVGMAIGRAMVPPRKNELEQFLKDLRRESENLRTL